MSDNTSFQDRRSNRLDQCKLLYNFFIKFAKFLMAMCLMMNLQETGKEMPASRGALNAASAIQVNNA